MRKPLIALIPAALLASAAWAQEVPETEPAPAELLQEEAPEEDQTDEEQEAAPPPAVETVATTGTWTRSTTNGRDTATYTSTDGEELFSATCMAADTETGDRIVQIKAASAEDTVGAIDLFTSAGNARVAAGPDAAPDLASGLTEPVSRPTYVLASGAGEIRIASGTRGITFETDPMLKEVIRNCQPNYLDGSARPPMPAAEDEVDADETGADEPAADDGAGT